MLKKLEEYDLIILTMVVVLTCFGVVMVYSASSIMAEKRFHDSFYFLKRQGLFALVGFGCMYAAMKTDYHFWKKAAVPVLGSVLYRCCLYLCQGWAVRSRGQPAGFVSPGFNFQPSELAKLSLIIFMAYSLDRKQEQIRGVKGLVPYMLILMAMIGLLMIQPDMGSSMTLAELPWSCCLPPG